MVTTASKCCRYELRLYWYLTQHDLGMGVAIVEAFPLSPYNCHPGYVRLTVGMFISSNCYVMTFRVFVVSDQLKKAAILSRSSAVNRW